MNSRSLLELPTPLLCRLALVSFDEPQDVGEVGKTSRTHLKKRCGFLLRLLCKSLNEVFYQERYSLLTTRSRNWNLQNAVTVGDVDWCRRLVAELDSQKREDKDMAIRSLVRAVWSTKIETLSLILSKADITRPDSMTTFHVSLALFFAVKAGNTAAVQRIIDTGFDLGQVRQDHVLGLMEDPPNEAYDLLMGATGEQMMAGSPS